MTSSRERTLVWQHLDDVLPLLRVGAEAVLVLQHDAPKRLLERLLIRTAVEGRKSAPLSTDPERGERKTHLMLGCSGRERTSRFSMLV